MGTKLSAMQLCFNRFDINIPAYCSLMLIFLLQNSTLSLVHWLIEEVQLWNIGLPRSRPVMIGKFLYHFLQPMHQFFLLLYCFQQRLFKDIGKVLRSEICRFWLSWPLNGQSNSKIVI